MEIRIELDDRASAELREAVLAGKNVQISVVAKQAKFSRIGLEKQTKETASVKEAQN